MTLRFMPLRALLMVVTLLAAVGAMSWQQAPRAWACDCAVLSTAEYGEAAELVAEGVVVGVDRPANPSSSAEDATYTVELTRVWKGPDAQHVAVLSAIDGASCGIEGIDEGSVIALFAHADGEAWRTVSCDGTRPMDDAAAAELTSALGEPVKVNPAVATPDPQPAPAEDRTNLLYIGLGAAGVALVVLAVIAWSRQRASNG